MFNLKKKEEVMNIDLKDATYLELVSYKIALLQVQINCNEQLARIKTKLEQIEKESKKDE
jgi:hypothetical protein|tara:strand:- start:741 stop:920 length:180 start_codon:yes stop_codon:yes gene_type:complete